MTPISSLQVPLAATSDAGILLHDVFGGLAVVVLLIAGWFLYQGQKQWFRPTTDTRDETRLGQKIGRMQMWFVYWGVVAVVIAYFFIVPRATSHRAQLKESTPTASAPNTP